MTSTETTTSPAPAAQPSDSFVSRFRTTTRALRHRNFRLFIIGQLLSVIGTWIQSVAQSWLVYRLTGSSVMLGAVSFATQVPYLLSPVGGVLADRFNRRKLLMLTQALMALQALLLAYLTLTNQIGVWTIFALALVLGVIGLFELTARQSFVVEMVGKEDLMNAIPLSSSMYNMGRVIGPSIAGALVVAIGEGWCFAVNGASFIAVIIGLWMMRLPARPPQTEEFAPVEQFREGLSHVLASKPIRELLANLGMLSFFCTTALMLMPVFADRELGGGPKTLGFLMTSFGGGALVGALLLASRPNLSGLSRRIVGSTLVYGFALVLFALAEWLPLACLLIACAGGGIMMQVAATNTALQSITPDRLRGRVVGYYGMMFLGMAPLGNLFAGWLADQIGVRWTVGLTSAVCVAIALHFNARRAVVADALRQAGQRAAA